MKPTYRTQRAVFDYLEQWVRDAHNCSTSYVCVEIERLCYAGRITIRMEAKCKAQIGRYLAYFWPYKLNKYATFPIEYATKFGWRTVRIEMIDFIKTRWL